MYLKILTSNILAGVFIFLLLPPIDAWYIGCAALVFPFYCLKRFTEKKAVLLNGFCFGIAFYFSVFFWIPPSIADVLGLSLILGWLLFLLVISGIGVLYAGLFFVLGFYCKKDWMIPLYWALFEIIFLPVFPISCGYFFNGSQFLSQAASLFGIYGLSMLAVYLNLALLQVVLQKEKKPLIRVSVLITVLCIYGFYEKVSLLQPTEKSLKTVLVHTAIDPIQKRDMHHKTYNEVLKQLEKAISLYPDADLYVLPESIFVPSVKEEVDGRFLEIRELLKNGQKVVLGTNTRLQGKTANSLVAFSRSYPDEFEVYIKRHLLLFGEYIPLLQYFPSIEEKLTKKNGLNHFIPGDRLIAITVDGTVLSPGICFEHLFSFVTREDIELLNADGIINISEDGWFKSLRASELHLMVSRFRSIENGRFMIKSLNVGISAFVLADGEIIKRSDSLNKDLMGPQAKSILYHELPVHKHMTIYSFFGYFLPIFLLLVIMVEGIYRYQRNKSELSQNKR